MIRAVLDTNAFVSGVVGFRRAESTPGELLRRWIRFGFELVTSDPLIAEIERALLKDYFLLRVDPADRRFLANALNERATHADLTISVSGVATHVADDAILATAASAAVDFLVTGDKGLLGVGSFQGVTIVTPRDFLTILDQYDEREQELNPLPILTTIGLDTPTSVQPVKGGADAAIWRVEHAGNRYALRVLRPDQTDQARRETVAMTAAATGGVPVPGTVINTTWNERPVLLLTWSPGQPLSAALLADPENLPRARALGTDFGRVQAAIHALPPPAELPTRSTFGESSDLTACLAAIPSRPPALLHLDYHPLNVLVEDERVTAVLDWANARTGDPRFDFARTLSILRLAPLPTSISEKTARSMRQVFETGWRHGYEQLAGPIGDLTPFCWWAGAVMERDLAPRVGRPDIPWLTPAYLGRVRRWTGRWRARASRQ